MGEDRSPKEAIVKQMFKRLVSKGGKSRGSPLGLLLLFHSSHPWSGLRGSAMFMQNLVLGLVVVVVWLEVEQQILTLFSNESWSRERTNQK